MTLFAPQREPGQNPELGLGPHKSPLSFHLTPSSPPRRPFLVTRRACPCPGPDACLHAPRNSPGCGRGCQAGRDRVGPARSCVRGTGEVKGQSLLSPKKEPPRPQGLSLTLSASCNPTSPRPQVTGAMTSCRQRSPPGRAAQEGEILGPRSAEAPRARPWRGPRSLIPKAGRSRRGRPCRGDCLDPNALLSVASNGTGVTSGHGPEGRAHNNEHSPPAPQNRQPPQHRARTGPGKTPR